MTRTFDSNGGNGNPFSEISSLCFSCMRIVDDVSGETHFFQNLNSFFNAVNFLREDISLFSTLDVSYFIMMRNVVEHWIVEEFESKNIDNRVKSILGRIVQIIDVLIDDRHDDTFDNFDWIAENESFKIDFSDSSWNPVSITKRYSDDCMNLLSKEKDNRAIGKKMFKKIHAYVSLLEIMSKDEMGMDRVLLSRYLSCLNKDIETFKQWSRNLERIDEYSLLGHLGKGVHSAVSIIEDQLSETFFPDRSASHVKVF